VCVCVTGIAFGPDVYGRRRPRGGWAQAGGGPGGERLISAGGAKVSSYVFVV